MRIHKCDLLKVLSRMSLVLLIFSFAYAGVVSVRSNVRGFSDNQQSFSPPIYGSDGGHKIVRSGNTLHTVFVSSSNNTHNLVYARSVDGGATWSAANQQIVASVNVISSTYWIQYPSIAVNGNNVYIVYALGQGTGASGTPGRKLMLIRDDSGGSKLIAGTATNSTIASGSQASWFSHTDIAVDSNGYVYVAAAFGNTVAGDMHFYRSTTSGGTTFSLVTTNSAAIALTPALSADSQGNVYLAYNDATLSKWEIKTFKYSSSSSSFTQFITAISNYRAMGVNLVNDPSGNMHMTYVRQDSNTGPMSLAYRMYNSSGTLLPGSSENLLTSTAVHSPQIGISASDNRIAVIQYVSNFGNGYSVNQIHKTSPSTWSVGRVYTMSNGGSNDFEVFSHMGKTVFNDKPDLLWYRQNTGTVYFHYDPPDKISPWQPDTPNVVWVNADINQSRNTTDNQRVSVNIGALAPGANHATPIQYNWTGSRVSIPMPTASWNASTTSTRNVADRQTVNVSVQLRDADNNVSEWSVTGSVYIADRTPPTGNFTITSNVIYAASGQRYTNTINVTLLTTGISDPTPQQSGMSGNVYVSNNIFDTTTLPTPRAFNNTSMNWSVSPNDGLKTVYASFYDVSSNYTSPNRSATINVDLTPPTLNNWTNPPISRNIGPTEVNTYLGAWNRAEDTTVNGVASGVAGYYVYLGQDANGTSNVFTTNTTRNMSFISPGKYYLRVQPQDNVGNLGDWVTVTIYDFTGRAIYGGVYIKNTPNYTITEPKYTNTMNVNLLFNYNYNPSEVGSVRVSWNNETSANFTNSKSLSSPSWNTEPNWPLAPTEGLRTVYAIYTGVTGSITLTSNTYVDYIIYDKTPPGVSTTSVTEGWTSVNNRAIFTWAPALDVTPSGVTVISGVGGYNVVWDTNSSNTPSAVTSANYQTYNSFNPPVCPTSGIYYLHVQAVDRAGNTGPWTIVLTYKYDGLAPVGTIDAPPTAYFRPIQLTLNATDLPAPPTQSGLVRLSSGPTVPTWNNAAMQINETGILGPTWSAVVTGNISYTLTDPGGGLKRVYVWYRDNAGNVSTRIESGFIDLKLADDHTGAIYINNDALGTSQNNVTLTLTYNATCTPSAIEMKLYNELSSSPNAAWVPAAPTYPWTLSPGDGIKTVYVEYRDSNGHTWGYYSDTIILKTTKPYGYILINNGADYTVTLSATLTLTAVDAYDMLIWNEGDAPGNNWVSYNAGAAWRLRGPDTDIGTRTVNVVFRDWVGNLSVTYNDTIEYVDQPYISIANGRTHTNTRLNDIYIGAPGAQRMSFSNYPDTGFSPFESYDIIKRDWDILPPYGDGVKWVYAVFEYEDGTRITVNDDIIYDTVSPDGAVLINNGDAYTISQLVELSLSVMDLSKVDMLISNYPDFRDAMGWEPFRPTRDWTLLPGDGTRTVWVQYRDEAGNTIVVTDDIELKTSGFYFWFIEPDGYNDVASENFTVSWEDGYPGDPDAYIRLYFNTHKNSPPDLTNQVLTPDAILVSNQVNGVIWDVSKLPTGKYYPYAIMSGIYGELRVYSDYPVYIVRGTDTPPTEDPGTIIDEPWPPISGEDPPAILVLTPTLPDTLPIQGIFTIQYQYAYTTEPAYISLYYDTNNDPRNSTTRVLITENMDVSTLVPNIDIYNWNVSGVPNGRYYIYAEIKTDKYTRSDYSTGTVLIDSKSKPGNGGGETIWSFPNPFSPITRGEQAGIAYTVKADGWVRVFIYNARGERIWQAADYARADANPGVDGNFVIWDGRNARGQTAGNGIYILYLTDERHKVLGRGRLTLLD